MSRKMVGGRTTAYSTILISRLMGLLATVLVGIAALSLAMIIYGLDEFPWYALPVACLILFGTVALLFSDQSIFRLIRGWVNRMLQQFGQGMDQTFIVMGQQKGTLIAAFSLSVLIIVAAVTGSVWVLAIGLGIDAPAYIHWIAVPIALVITLLPISFNGAGIREIVFVVVYAKVNVDAASATALGLAFTALLTVVGLAGGVFLLHSWRSSGST